MKWGLADITGVLGPVTFTCSLCFPVYNMEGRWDSSVILNWGLGCFGLFILESAGNFDSVDLGEAWPRAFV